MATDNPILDIPSPVGLLGDVRAVPHTLLPDRLFLRVFWTNKRLEYTKGQLALLEYHGHHPEEQTLVLDKEDIVGLIEFLQNLPPLP